MKLKALVLSPEDRSGLEKVVDKGRDWRMRHRAQTLLYFADGWRAKEIDDLLAAADKGEIELAYSDEVGFDSTHPNRSAWTPVGQCHASEPLRDKRLNVVGALLSSGELFTMALWQTMTAMRFVGFLGLLSKHVGKPLVVIVDNASVHRAKAIKPLLKLLERQGLKPYFLPPYSPELNRIEKLWHKMKYEWMAFKARDAKTALRHSVWNLSWKIRSCSARIGAI